MATSFDLTGRLYEKNDTQAVTDKFKKREFVIEKKETSNDKEFVELIKFQLSQDRCDKLDPFTTGNEIKVTFNIKGRKWEKDGKVSYFTTLEAWKLEKMGGETPVQATQQTEKGMQNTPYQFDENGQDNGDLPF